MNEALSNVAVMNFPVPAPIGDDDVQPGAMAYYAACASGFIQLTEGDGEHEIQFSPNRRCFLDTWSRADAPPVHEWRLCEDGSKIAEIESVDAGELLATGWRMPERFVAKGRDGKTDIHGILIKPSHFDPTKHYPIVEQIYAGPPSSYAPKKFGILSKQHQLAELGFIVVQVDGMGTNDRGKAFHDVCWKNLKDAGFPDRIAWIKAAAATRPWMDLTRVGIGQLLGRLEAAADQHLDHLALEHRDPREAPGQRRVGPPDPRVNAPRNSSFKSFSPTF